MRVLAERCPGCGRAIGRFFSDGPRCRHRRVARDPSSAWCNGAPAPARGSLRIASVEIEAEGDLPVTAALGLLRELGGGASR